MELCRGETGKLLRRFSFSECEGGAGSEFRGVRRSALLQALADALPPDTISFGCSVSNILEASPQKGAVQAAAPSLRVTVEGQGAASLPSRTLECDLLVGADGTRSSVAKHLGLADPTFSGYSAIRGVAQLGALGLGSVNLPGNTIRQVWGAGIRAGIYPMSEEELYWFVCFNDDGLRERDGASAGDQIKEALTLTAGWGWGLEKIIQATPEAQVRRGERLLV